VVYVSDRIVALCETGRGQLEGCGEYWMGMSESGLMSDSELRGGSPCPCWLRTDHLALVNKFDYVLALEDLWSPVNLVASVTAWSNHNRYSMVVVGGRMR
jgi:hypothetical protein